MARRPRDPPPVDLSHFSATECARIWEVLQKDFHLRFREEQRLQRLKSQLAKVGEKASTLGSDPNFNEKYCIICFQSFWFLFNPKERCFVCLCNVCRSCSRYLKPHQSWLCCLCEEERTFAAKQCSWFYDGVSKKFVVGSNRSPLLPQEISQHNSDPLVNQMRVYLQEFVARIKQEGETGNFSEEEIQAHVASGNFSMPSRAVREEALKRITAHPVMRFHQKMSEVTGEAERFLRSEVRYEIPEAGVNGHYDKKMDEFRTSVASILRNFSQSLYIAIEGHHSQTGETVEDVHLGVQQILQDKVESLVGCRVDIVFETNSSPPMTPTDDDCASMISDDVGRSNEQGLTVHDRLADFLLNKLLNDHQTFLDDQQLTASDMYTETALERVLAQKTERRAFGELSDDFFGQEVDPDLLSAGGSGQSRHRGFDSRDVAKKAIGLEGSLSSSGSGGNWLLAGHPTARCSDSLRGFGQKSDQSDENPDSPWKNLGEFGDDSDDNMSSLSSNRGAPYPSRVLTDRKISVASLDFDDVYRRNLTLSKDQDATKERLEQSSRSEDSGVHVSGSSPPTLERKISLGFSRMDWSFNERSDPHFVAKPEQVVVEEGECALIDVTADGTLPIEVFWHRCQDRELHQLEEKGRVEFQVAPDHPGKSSLLLWDARKEDEGEYLATAVNDIGTTNQGFKVLVKARTFRPKAPEFLQEMSDEFVREGGTARLFCKVQGTPKPRVQFLRAGLPLRSNDKTKIMRISQRSVSLTIFDVRREDEGCYTCVASNCGGSVRCEARVQISTSDFYSSDPTPEVDHSPTVKVKTQVSLLCPQTSVEEAPCSATSKGKQMRQPMTSEMWQGDKSLRREGPKSKTFSAPKNQFSNNVELESDRRRPTAEASDSEKQKENNDGEGIEKREKERRERALKEREESERREKEARRRKESSAEEGREFDVEERSRRFERRRKEREEREEKERLVREEKELKEREAKEREEQEKMKREEEARRKKEERERAARRERREKERMEREEKERKEREAKARQEKEDRERKEVEERIRVRRLERERREQEEQERRERERIEKGEEEEEEEREEEDWSEGEYVSLPTDEVESHMDLPYASRSLELPVRTSVRSAPVSDIKTLIENGKLRPVYSPNMKASFRTRKFPSVSEIRDKFSRSGAYGKRPTPVPVKISGKKGVFKKQDAPAEAKEPAADFRAVSLKSTGVQLQK